MPIEDPHTSMITASFKKSPNSGPESTLRIHPHTGNSAEPERPSDTNIPGPEHPICNILIQGPIRQPAEFIACFRQGFTELLDVHSIASDVTSLRETEGETLGEVEGLIERRNKGANPTPNALFQGIFALSECFTEFHRRKTGEPFVLERMACHFMTGLIDALNLPGIMVGLFAGQRCRPNHREARRDT